ncbi:interleukin-13 receptor subunit alpha-2 [Ranitomeya imitator]|uniref:interleukin-13 receptor subunit alpha-2 n=1 Tax=Ranitomeya imitator TaxID=111125 RepID=UPI0037E6FFC7
MRDLDRTSLCNNMKSVSLQWISRFIVYLTLPVPDTSSLQMAVGPPNNVHIKDLGNLGILEMSWEPPAFINSTSECPVRYEITHQVVNEQRWKSVRIKQLTYRGAFNLEKNATIKMRTYLKGQCTEGNEVWSEWVEANYQVSLQGAPETKVKDFRCINHKYENLKCEWKSGVIGSNDNYELLYWQDGMSQKKMCRKYMTQNEMNTGCDFGSEVFEMFSDLFICVTGIPSMDPIRPSYFILQPQSIGKPGIPENLNLTMDISDELVLSWKEPKGKLPAHCFQYEIQSKNQMDMWQSVANQKESSQYSVKRSETSNTCLRVRGKANIYCADDGYWSDWSPELCWTEPPPELHLMWLYCIAAVITVFTGLCVVACVYTVRKRRQWSKKLQCKAKELAYEIDSGHSLKC